ncbi:hypothetical protein ZOD2009_04487 [Haladaptatus paucihalophilus DX253]|uniref:DIX domain-containing protein n=1 Tax=Haladaptatus paucihalophilus DX253 TaxID=797209 RepID=E7QQ27_HALPU|nr:hypothetical protein [Haladaptatus paucihalophilus]EFW93091.1 hypothetical protein ZOD2009_04487 [Haladaptatus paucihalophilus DX253]SHK44423.1 hypothetical protein SAMN05444342_1281 [Haladaptatus paucihalophilus DX253]
MSPARDDSDPEGRKVISPEELDIEDSENVVTLDDGRFVIGASGRPSVPDDPEAVTTGEPTADANPGVEPAPPEKSPSSTDSPPAIDPASAPDTPSQSAPSDGEPHIDSQDVREWLEDDVGDVASRYGFHITAKAEDEINHQRMFSDDIGTVFDSLLMWYAQQVEPSMPVEDVLGILMMESNVRVRYPSRCFRGVLGTYDLSPDDSIADLFRAMQDANGIVFPPENG